MRFTESTLASRATGTTFAAVAGAELRAHRIPLAPAKQQERIVVVIDEYLSRLDAAQATLESALKRLRALEKAIIIEQACTRRTPDHWQVLTVADAGTVGLGLQRSPKRHNGANLRPYLRVANVFEDRIDGSDVMSMDITDAEWERYRLHPGDVLLNEGQSPHLLGRPAVYRGDPPDVAFTNSLIRFRPRDGVDPEWALLVFRAHMHSGRFQRESKITTNIAHLAAGRFKTVEFPVPPLDEQSERVAEARAGLEQCARIRAAIPREVRGGSSLRRAVLEAAFEGRLVPQDADAEPASVLLERIRAEREAQGATKRTRKVKAS